MLLLWHQRFQLAIMVNNSAGYLTLILKLKSDCKISGSLSIQQLDNKSNRSFKNPKFKVYYMLKQILKLKAC